MANIYRTNHTAFNVLTVDGLHITRMRYHEDFLEAAAALASTTVAKAYWTGGGSSGTQAVAAGVNGLMNLDTTTTGSRTSTLTFSTADFATDQNPHMETYLSTSNITNSKIEFGFYASSNDYLLFRFDSAVDANNIYIASNNNNAGDVAVSTSIPLVATKNKKFKIEISSTLTFRMFIDDVEITNKTGLSIRKLSTFKPYFYVDNKSAAESKVLSIDYVLLSQDRA